MVATAAVAVGSRAGRSEKTVRQDPVTGRQIWQMTRSDQASLHSYYDLCPWNAAGDKIVFCAAGAAGEGSDVYWMDAQDGTLHLVGHSGKQNPHTGVHQQWIGLGDVVAYEDRDAQGPFVQTVDLRSGRTTRLPGAARMVSPDGRLVASHTESVDEAAIMRRETAGVFIAGIEEHQRPPRLIASIQQALDLNPRRDDIRGCHIYVKHAKFSPDGRRLSFVFTNEISYEVKYREPRVKDIYVVDADGQNLRFVCHFSWGNHPSWHPNGRQILFNHRPARGTPLVFMLADADSGALEPATTLINGGGHPPYSPDGSRIAAEYVNGQTRDARVVSVDLSRQRVDDLARFRVTDHSHQGTHIHPTWSRDGRYVLFNADESGHSELWVVPVDPVD